MAMSSSQFAVSSAPLLALLAPETFRGDGDVEDDGSSELFARRVAVCCQGGGDGSKQTQHARECVTYKRSAVEELLADAADRLALRATGANGCEEGSG